MLLCLLSTFNSERGIFRKYYHDKIISVNVSNTSKLHFDGRFQDSSPDLAIQPVDKKEDWSSGCSKNHTVFPWITFSLKNKKFVFDAYFIRSGCGYYGYCCDENIGCCACTLYSWLLQISDDNFTWIDVHKVEKDKSLTRCRSKTYQMDSKYTAKYIRLIQTEATSGEPPCIAINRIDFLGKAINDDGTEDISEEEEADAKIENLTPAHDEDEDISIIGHVSKYNHHQAV